MPKICLSQLCTGLLVAAAVIVLSSSCSRSVAQNPPVQTSPAQEGAICTEPRPQMCYEIYQPVCGYTAEGASKTYGNSCQACAHAEVVRYTQDACKTD